MATRGRKPSPIELKLVRGNPGKRPLNITARVLRQDEALACDRPTMLLEEAASYWDYAFAHAPRTLIKKLDVYLLAAWANAAARYEHNIRLAAKSDAGVRRAVRDTRLQRLAVLNYCSFSSFLIFDLTG